MVKPTLETSESADADLQKQNDAGAETEADDVSFATNVQWVRNQIYAAARYGLELGSITQYEANTLMHGLDSIADKKELDGWLTFIGSSDGLSSQIRKYESIRSDFDRKMMGARDVISGQSANQWERRFRESTLKEKEYFLHHQFDEFVKNWNIMAARRENLAPQARRKLAGSDIPNLPALFNADTFRELTYREKADLIGRVEAALSVENDGARAQLHRDAEQKLMAAVGAGTLSKNKVGVWLKRIFAGSWSNIEIREFIHGKSSHALPMLIISWSRVAREFDDVKNAYVRAAHQPMGFSLVSKQKFLDMHFDRRGSYVKEAKRVLETSQHIDKEHPSLLRIRHFLDIRDWESAEEEINRAQATVDRPEDGSRLQSMRQYLKQHRTMPGSMEKSDGNRLQRAQAALQKITSAQAEMDPVVGGVFLRKLLAYGSQAVSNARTGFYNRIWVEKNGYLNERKAQKNYEQNRERSMQKARHGEDPGMHDVIDTQETTLVRRDEDQKASKIRATIQYANFAEPNVASNMAEWYKDRDPKVLYWTTIVGHKNGMTMDTAWHMKHFVLLSDIRSAMRTIEDAGYKYLPGHKLFDTHVGSTAYGLAA